MGTQPDESQILDELLAGRPTATARAVEVLLPKLLTSLRRRLKRANLDLEAMEGSAIGALLDFVQRPEKYNPASLALVPYLTMVAERDFLNWERGERRRQAKHVSLEVVENRAFDGNTSIDDTLDEENRLMAWQNLLHAEFPLEVDRSMIKLMLEGERRTSAFAAVLGLSADAPETARAVKKNKDRLAKRLRRMQERADAN